MIMEHVFSSFVEQVNDTRNGSGKTLTNDKRGLKSRLMSVGFLMNVRLWNCLRQQAKPFLPGTAP
jgi:hypothetical protein